MIEGIEYKKPYKHNDETKQRKNSLASLTDIIFDQKGLVYHIFRSHHEFLCVGEGYNICVSSICGYLWQ